MTQGTATLTRNAGTAQTNDPTEWREDILRRLLSRKYDQPQATVGKAAILEKVGAAEPTAETKNPIVYSCGSAFNAISKALTLALADMGKISGVTNLPGRFTVEYLDPYQLAPGSVSRGTLIDWSQHVTGHLTVTHLSLAMPEVTRENARILSFLEQVYGLAESGQVRQAAAKIMEYTDGLLHAGQFDVCGHLLDRVDFPRLSKWPSLLVGFLGITFGAKEKLGWSRKAFYASAKVALSRQLQNPERAERILRSFQ